MLPKNFESMLDRRNQNCISYWWPRVKASGVLAPKTELFIGKTGLVGSICGEECPELDEAREWVKSVAKKYGGYPVFLRAGHLSGKHSWPKTCFLGDESEIDDHLRALTEECEIADIMGFPSNVWAVRELLKTNSIFTAFHGFPVTCERRYFFKDGKVVCHHPYWPEQAIRQGLGLWDPMDEGLAKPSDDDQRKLNHLGVMNLQPRVEIEHLTKQSEIVAKQFEGSWSIDWLQTAEGHWHCIDMARAEDSYHWDNCPVAKLNGWGTRA